MHLGNGEEGTQSMNTYLEMGVNVRSIFPKPPKIIRKKESNFYSLTMLGGT